MSDPAGIPALIEAIRHLHGCEASHVETVPVREVFNGEVMWKGEVEVFDVTGHPLTTRVVLPHPNLGRLDAANLPRAVGRCNARALKEQVAVQHSIRKLVCSA